MTEALGNFNISHEEARVRNEFLNITSIEQYRHRRDALISYNTDQMITNLGERFNVILSTYTYEIRDGELWGKDMDEPFMETLVRGRNYRKEHGNPLDHRREEAEVVGFSKIQKIMTDESTPIGSIILSVSPPGLEGSTYANNFVDIHTKKQDEKGKIYVESQRVSSGLTIEETKEKVSAFAAIEVDENDPAASFLEQPIFVGDKLTAEDIRFYFYREHDYMDERTFNTIKKGAFHLISEYAKSMVQRPDDRNYHRLLYNAVLNKADEIYERIKVEGVETVGRISPIRTNQYIRQEIMEYGNQKVKEVRAGCGISGGFDLKETQNASYSVSEFGAKKDKYGERNFKCPACKKENVRPHNKLLSRCQHCRSTEVAC